MERIRGISAKPGVIIAFENISVISLRQKKERLPLPSSDFIFQCVIHLTSTSWCQYTVVSATGYFQPHPLPPFYEVSNVGTIQIDES